MNVGFLEVIACASADSQLVKLIENYKDVIYSKTLKEAWECFSPNKVKTKFYSELQLIFNGKNPDNTTVKQLMELCKPYLFDGIVDAMPLLKTGRHSLNVTLLIHTDKLYHTYLSALMLPQELRLDSYLQIGNWIVHRPSLVLPSLQNEYC